MDRDMKDLLLEIQEELLEAQLRAVRRLRSGPRPPRAERGRSHVDLAFDVLQRAGRPLHVTEILARISKNFGQNISRESLVSALTKKVAAGDRFTRPDKNTFGLRGA